MSLSDVMADQLRMPAGPMAPLVGASLNRRNHALLEHTIAALDVGPGDRVLDVGFGGGLSLGLMAAAVGDGHVCGIDPSPEMVAGAKRRLAPHIRRGRVSVERGSVESVPFSSGCFNRVLTSQTVYFWDDFEAGLAELYRVLSPGGRLAVAMMPRSLQERFGFGERGYRVLDHHELMVALETAGFVDVSPWPPRVPAGESWVVVAHRPARQCGHVSR